MPIPLTERISMKFIIFSVLVFFCIIQSVIKFLILLSLTGTLCSYIYFSFHMPFQGVVIGNFKHINFFCTSVYTVLCIDFSVVAKLLCKGKEVTY